MTVAAGFSNHSNSTSPESGKVPRVGRLASLKFPVGGVSSAWPEEVNWEVFSWLSGGEKHGFR